MCEHDSYDVPACAIWKLSFWTVLVSIAFIVILLVGPFSKLLTPRISFFGSGTISSQSSDHSASPSVNPSEVPSSNRVWVDTETGIYHKSSGLVDESGHAKVMSESDPVRAGYRSATTEYHRRF